MPLDGASRRSQPSLPPTWQWVRLGDVCEETAGVRDPRSEPEKSFRYLDITSVDNSAKRIVDPRTLLGGDAPSRARQVIRAGDVIVSTTRPNLNAVAMVPQDLDDQVCSTGFCVLRAKKGLAPAYLFAFVRTAEFVQSLSNLVEGALYPEVTDKHVRDQVMPLPPLPEQQRIAAILNEQMAAVERARAAAEVRLEASKALPGAYLCAVFKSPEAQQWPRKRLDTVCEVQLGKMLSPKSKTGTRSRPYLRNANVQWNRFELSEVIEMDFTEEEEEKFVLRPGDLLVCEGGEPGRAAVWSGQMRLCCYQKALHRLRPIDGCADPYFLMHRLWFGAVTDEFFDSQARTTIAHLPAVRLGSLLIGLPSIAEQQRIAAVLNEQMAVADRARKAIEDELVAINVLPAALLRRAFLGAL